MKMFAALATVTTLISVTPAAGLDWTQVDEVFGRQATVSQNIHRYGFPRTDLTVTLDEVSLKTAFALGGWVAFQPMDDQAMLMGDLVLTETEINPVMAKVLANGLEVTALHNHLLRASPATFYMHIEGHGDPVNMAVALREALVLSKTPLAAPKATTGAAGAIGLDTESLDKIIGIKGRTNGGVYQFSVPRTDVIRDDGMVIPAALGTAHAINFQATGDGRAAITGDFAALSNEVVPLISSLREQQIEVTAIHNHMLHDEPHTFFIHFWANDDATKLARAVRAALDTTKTEPRPQ